MKNNRKITLITNFILVAIIFLVCTISFLPERIIPIYGGNQVSAIYNGNREKNQVSLMFNVYENTQVVNAIIDTLDQNGVKATFFVGGCWADDNAKTLNRIVESGHEIGNHGYFHLDHKKLDYGKNKEEIAHTNLVIKALCGVEPTLFAPPSGSYSETTLEVCYDLKQKVIMWSKDTIDWRDSDTALIKKRATENVTNGDLILMHPKEHTLKVLDQVIKYYLDLGLSVVTVSENIA